MDSKEIAKIISDKVIAGLKDNPEKWIKSWQSDRPMNFATKRPYTGGNWLWLNMWTDDEKVGKTNQWCTYNQAKKLTGLEKPIKKGMKSVPVFFYKPWATEDKHTGEDKLIQVMKVYRVFNFDALEGDLKLPEISKLNFRQDNVEKVIKSTEAKYKEGYTNACYIPSLDVIHMPKFDKFNTAEDYYATLLHELTHWTGNKSRLDRKLNESRFGEEAYAFEELVAELGSAMLCNANGVKGKLQHTQYIASWLKVLENDSKHILKAASLAQKAFDFIMKTPKFEEITNVSK
jgi:antirestriction protein ArdC